MQPHREVAAGGHLHRARLAVDDDLEVHELVGRYVVGQDVGLLAVLANAHQLRGPHQGVEDGVVLADEVDQAGVGLLPVLAPTVRLPRFLRPLHRGRNVTDAGVEPDVEALVLVAGLGDRHAPGDVARYGAILEAGVDDAEDKVPDLRPPVVPALDVLPQPVAELGEVQVQVRRLPDLGRPAGDLGVRLYELVGLVPRAAVVALVAPRLLVAAHGAGPLDVAVRQEAALGRAVHLLALGLGDVPALL